MSKYNPTHLQQLLKLSCWYSKAEYNKVGFTKLVDEIYKSVTSPAINLRYLENLSSELKSRINSNELISKSEDQVIELLNHCDFTTWQEFEDEIDSIESFINEYPDISRFEGVNAVILSTELEIDKMRPLISFHKKLIDFSVRMTLSNSDKLSEVEHLLEENTYVISHFSPKTEDCDIHPIDLNRFDKLTSSNRFVPVWSGNPLSDYQISGIKKHQRIIGHRGVMLSLLVLNVAKDKKSEAKKGIINSSKSGYQNHITNFKGIVSHGDLNVGSGGLSMGDTNHYYSDKSKKDEN